MRVILQKNIIGLGDFGEVKEVANGYARNYLLPKKLAVTANASTTKAIIHQKNIIELRRKKRKDSLQDVAKKISELAVLTLTVKSGANSRLFGSVTNKHVAAALDEKGILIDRRKIELGEKNSSSRYIYS